MRTGAFFVPALHAPFLALRAPFFYTGSKGDDTMDQKKTGALIRALRLERGLTQRELAEQLHVSARAVSKWETGHGMLLWYCTRDGLFYQNI